MLRKLMQSQEGVLHVAPCVALSSKAGGRSIDDAAGDQSQSAVNGQLNKPCSPSYQPIARTTWRPLCPSVNCRDKTCPGERVGAASGEDRGWPAITLPETRCGTAI